MAFQSKPSHDTMALGFLHGAKEAGQEEPQSRLQAHVSTETQAGTQSIHKVFSTVSLIPQLFNNSLSSGLVYEIPVRMRGKKIEDLMGILESSLNRSLQLPIQYLENELFELCSEYFMHLDPSHISLKAFSTLHPLLKLLDVEDYQSTQVNFIEILSEYLRNDQNALKEYDFLKKFIHFINDLCISWDIVNVYNYRARFNQELEYTKFLDLDSMFGRIINPELIWLSIIVDTYPLGEILTNEAKELGRLLQSVFMKTFHVFMRCNKEALKKSNSIREWLSYKNPVLNKKFAFPHPMKVPKPLYQELSINMFTKVTNRPVIALKQQLESLELAYREFERSLLLNFITILKVTIH